MDLFTTDYETKNNYFFLFFILCFMAVLIIHFSLPVIAFISDADMDFAGVLYCAQSAVFFIEFLLSVQLEFLFYIRGLVAVCILNSVIFFISLYRLFFYGNLFAATGLVFPILTVLLCIAIFLKLSVFHAGYNSLKHMAFLDDLTGLSNRKRILAGISNLIDSGQFFFILFIDLDDFNKINDSLGHEVGSIFLNEVVHNVKQRLYPEMIFGRMEGDKFLLIVPSEMTGIEIEKFAAEINSVVSKPFLYKSRMYMLTCSIGVAAFSGGGNTADILRCADMALTTAKLRGKNRTVFYNEKIRQYFDERQGVELALHTAIRRRELYLVFQPQYDAKENRLCGYEAFARWNSPIYGEIQPSRFISLAEENGDILRIGRWIMTSAFRSYLQMREQKKIDAAAVLALHISLSQFRNPYFIEEIREVIKKTGMPAERIELEITEFVCEHVLETKTDSLEKLIKMGIKIALDAFGSDYASLNFLRLLPITVIKIDRSFIESIGVVPERENMVRPIIDMAHQLRLKVVAEGVEREMQYASLVKWGCDYLQGYYFSKPVNFDHLNYLD